MSQVGDHGKQIKGYLFPPEGAPKQTSPKTNEVKGALLLGDSSKSITKKTGFFPAIANLFQRIFSKQKSEKLSELVPQPPPAKVRSSAPEIQVPEGAKKAIPLLDNPETKQKGIEDLFSAIKDSNTDLTRKVVSDLQSKEKGDVARDLVKYAISVEKNEEKIKDQALSLDGKSYESLSPAEKQKLLKNPDIAEKHHNLHQSMFRGNTVGSAGYAATTKAALKNDILKAAEPHEEVDKSIMAEDENQNKYIENYAPVDAFLGTLIECINNEGQEFAKDFLEIHKEVLDFAAVKYPDNPVAQKMFLVNVFILRCVSPTIAEHNSNRGLAAALLKAGVPDNYATLPEDTLDKMLSLANTLIMAQEK